MKRVSFLFILIASVLLVSNLTVFAGTTGKIKGIIKDAKSGEPLPGVNVVIQGTTLGAATDADGFYIILLVPPGNYTMEASMIGYTTKLATEVHVNIDRTAIVDFNLEQEVLKGDVVVVEAKRDLVRLDVSASETAISKKNMENIPFVRRVEDAIGMQAGVTGNIIEGEISIRQGDASETNVLVDGYSTTDVKFNRPVFAVSTGAVQEIEVIRGGYNAEYGQARSGVINIVTKDPSDEFHLNVDYQAELPGQHHGGRNRYDPQRMWQYQLYDGPNSMDSTLIVRYEGITPDTIRFEGWNSYSNRLLGDSNPDNDLTSTEAKELWEWRHRPIDYGKDFGHNLDLSLSGGGKFLPWRTNILASVKYQNRPYTFPQSRDKFVDEAFTIKLVNRFSSSTRLTLTGLHDHIATVTEGSSTSSWSGEDRLSYGGGGSEPFYFFRKPTVDRYSTLLGLKLLHIFSPTMFFQFDASSFSTDWTIGTGKAARPEDGRLFHNRLYYDPESGWIPRSLGADDEVSGFRMYGGGTTWDNSYGRKYTARAALVDQFHPAHELKAGFEFRYDVINEDRTKWKDDDSTKTFLWRSKAEPFQMGAYIQDKIEFQGMIANIGVRWDYYNVNGERPDVFRTLEYATNEDIFLALKDGTFPTRRPKAKFYFSPRIGVSFPITTSSKVYFNYGHFVQIPNSEAMYSTTLDFNMPRVQWMSNAFLTYQKSINYELGVDQNVKGYFQFHVGLFYKDYSDVQSGMVYAHVDQSLVEEWPLQREYREVRGIDIEIRKSTGRFLTGFFNYNVTQKSVSNLEIPGLSDIPIITDNPTLGVNGELKGVPLPNIPELTPYGRGVITLSAPENWGPRVADYPILHKTRASFSVFYTGPVLVNHPDGSFREQHPDVKFYTIPYLSSNLRITRNINVLKNTNVELYLDIGSIFSTKYRNIGGRDYYDDLFINGKTDKVGSEDVSNKLILRTESKDLYRGKVHTYMLGLRFLL